MKLACATIKPFRRDDVRQALQRLGVTGMTASEVKGFGRQRGQSDSYRGMKYQVFFLPKIKIKVWVPDALADAARESITAASRTGKIGEGKILVLDVGQATRVRTVATGDQAI